MVTEAICGAMAGMYIYHHIKGAVEAVRELRETKKETARKLVELEEAKKDLVRFKELRAKLEREKAEAKENEKFYRDLCKKADLLIDPSASMEDFERQLDNPNSVFVFDD